MQDAVGILQGGDGAATAYLKSETEPAVQQAFAPDYRPRASKLWMSRAYWTPAGASPECQQRSCSA